MIKVKGIKEQMLDSIRDLRVLRNQQVISNEVASVAFITMAEKGDIDVKVAAKHKEMFLPWADKTEYKKGNLRTYEGEFYRCEQPHTSQSDWTPDKVSMWTKVGDPNKEYPDWIQPIHAESAYNVDDKVTYKGEKWICTEPNNVYAPDVFGWKKVVK